MEKIFVNYKALQMMIIIIIIYEQSILEQLNKTAKRKQNEIRRSENRLYEKIEK